MLDLNKALNFWLNQGLKEDLIKAEDMDYIIYRLKAILKNDHLNVIDVEAEDIDIYGFLETYLIEERQFSTKEAANKFMAIMDVVLGKPSHLKENFRRYYKRSPQQATNYLYKLMTFALWLVDQPNDFMDSTIEDINQLLYGFNQDKQEKLNQYPHFRATLTSFANENYGWYWLYHPKPVFAEEAILYKKDTEDLHTGQKSFNQMLDFINKFPHYFIGSNIESKNSKLSHHFRVGRDDLPFAHANILMSEKQKRMRVEVLEWPMPLIRIIGNNENKLVDEIHYIFKAWKQLETQATYHSVNLVIKLDGSNYHVYMLLRTVNDQAYMDIRDLLGFNKKINLNRVEADHPMLVSYPENLISFVKKAM